jgi:hypothetical protein
MSDVGVLPKLLSVLHSLPLWILAGFAGAGYALLFVPSFGGVDAGHFKKTFGEWCWVDAIVFSVLTAACAIDLVVKQQRAQAKRHRQQEAFRYTKIYEPLFANLMSIYISTYGGSARTFRERLVFARLKLTSGKSKRSAITAAYKALFDRKARPPVGEVEYGGDFPLSQIDRVVKSNLKFCDDALLNLVARAVATRMEEGGRRGYLTVDDVKVYDHIVRQRELLRNKLNH